MSVVGPTSHSVSPVARTLPKTTITPRDIYAFYDELSGLHSAEDVVAKALSMMETRSTDDIVKIYLAARTLFVDRWPGRAEMERGFVDAIGTAHPPSVRALADVRVLSHMLLLQNDDEDHYGFVLELCRYICIQACVPFKLPMFRFKLHALRLQATASEQPYNRIFADRDMSPVLFFLDEVIKSLEEKRVLVLDDAVEREDARQIADEVTGGLGFEPLSYESFTGRIMYDRFVDTPMHEPRVVQSDVDWYDTITHKYARCVMARKRTRG